MTVYTENITKNTLTDHPNFAMTETRDENEFKWPVEENYENDNYERNSRASSGRGDNGVLASHMSDNMSQGYFPEQRKGNDSASYNEYYLREWEMEALYKLSMRRDQPEEQDWSPAPPEAFEIGKDFGIDGPYEVETELSRDFDNMILNPRNAPLPRLPMPRHPDHDLYLFDFSQNEDGASYYMRDDPFSFKDLDTYTP